MTVPRQPERKMINISNIIYIVLGLYYLVYPCTLRENRVLVYGFLVFYSTALFVKTVRFFADNKNVNYLHISPILYIFVAEISIYREGCPLSRDMGAIRKHQMVIFLKSAHPNPILRDASNRKARENFAPS